MFQNALIMIAAFAFGATCAINILALRFGYVGKSYQRKLLTIFAGAICIVGFFKIALMFEALPFLAASFLSFCVGSVGTYTALLPHFRFELGLPPYNNGSIAENRPRFPPK